MPSDPESMRFPHAYGPVPTSAVLAVVRYLPAGRASPRRGCPRSTSPVAHAGA